jgi:hypothetical protein
MPLKPINTKERFENLIKTPRGVVTYAQHKKEPVPELEHIILQDDLAIYWYAYYVLHQRWPKGEQKLLKGTNIWGPSAYILNRYAQSVMKERWPEAEPVILNDEIERPDYTKHFKYAS